MTAREETQQQIERCAQLERRLAQQRRALRRECTRQRSALRRAASRIDHACRGNGA